MQKGRRKRRGGKRGFEVLAWFRKRARPARAGEDRFTKDFSRAATDSLAVCAEDWIAALRALNYAGTTLVSRLFGLRKFLLWAQERDVTRASEVTRPVLEAYQRWLTRAEPVSGRGKGKRLSWSTQRERVRSVKEWFRWLTRRDVLMHNPASEIELPRPEKRLPVAALTLAEIEKLLAVHDLADPLGVRDRAMCEVF
jgi:integrase/recombinase XerD